LGDDTPTTKKRKRIMRKEERDLKREERKKMKDKKEKKPLDAFAHYFGGMNSSDGDE